MDLPDDDHLQRSVTELGEPESLYRTSRTRFLAKLTLGVLLLIYGVIANAWWWTQPNPSFGHLELFLLIVVPLSGGALLMHMYRERGLYVLIYETGLLRLRRGEVDSIPWRDVDYIRLKVQRATGPELERDDFGNPTACWLPVDVPTFQLWNASLSVAREDGLIVHFGPVLSEYDRLAEEIQRRTFTAVWPLVWSGFLSGRVIQFGDIEVSRAGIRHSGKFLSWIELKELTVAQGKLSIKQTGKWLPWALADINGIPNPHVLFALATEAKRVATALPGEPKTARDR